MSQAHIPDPRLEQAKAILSPLTNAEAPINASDIFQEIILQALATLERLDYTAFALLRARLKHAKISLWDLDKALISYHPRLRIVDDDEPTHPGTAQSYIPDAPLPDLIIPHPYTLRNEATMIMYKNDDPDQPPREQAIAFAPLLITGRLRHIEDNIEWFRLEWKRHPQWRSEYVDRGIALNAAKLVDLEVVDYQSQPTMRHT